MKKVLAISLALYAASVTGLFLKELVVHAEGGPGGGGVPVGNGDVDGSWKIDIGDAIYILTYLYLGGPPPVAIEFPPNRLPATGQTKCYDNGGNEIPCGFVIPGHPQYYPNPDYPEEDGYPADGRCPSEGRFVDNGDGTVTDNCTGLIWQKDTAPGKYTWQDALKYCENLDLAGHMDWRLPNVRELESIVDYGRFHQAIDPGFEAVSGLYWSSSSYVLAPSLAWFVYFGVGYDGYDAKDHDYYFVRAVRSGP